MNQPNRTTEEMAAFIYTHVKYLDWEFVVKDDKGGRPYLQIQFMGPDADYPDAIAPGLVLQKCRKWFLSPYMTNTELVRTAHKAVLAAVEHEACEHFKYLGKAIFSPHTDIEHLWWIQSIGSEDKRK